MLFMMALDFEESLGGGEKEDVMRKLIFPRKSGHNEELVTA